LIAVEYLPASVEMAETILAAIFRFQEAHERLLRLCDAVKAVSAH
jgi:hypothetical protein